MMENPSPTMPEQTGETSAALDGSVRRREKPRQAPPEALRESEAKFRALAEESPTGISVIQDGRFVYVNERYAEIFGYAADEMIDSMPVEAVVHPEDRPKVRENLRRRLEGEVDALHFRARGLTKDERTIDVEVYGRRFLYGGRPAVIGSVVDVTEKRRLQRDVLNMQEEERRRLGQDLHDGVASQLTGVIIMLSTATRMMDEDHPAYDRLQEAKTRIKESCEDVRRLSRGLSPVSLSDAGLSAALGRLAEHTEHCHFERDETLPALSDEEETHLYWIAQEAVANARKYAGEADIAVGLTRTDGEVVLSIEDDGEGFDPSEQEEGGLGLRTMEYRADLLGATLTIDAAPGRGTRVVCALPE